MVRGRSWWNLRPCRPDQVEVGLELCHSREAHLERGFVPLDGCAQFSNLTLQSLKALACRGWVISMVERAPAVTS